MSGLMLIRKYLRTDDPHGKSTCRSCRRFRCSRCRRWRPWCFGAGDAHPGWCDQCFAKYHVVGKNCGVCTKHERKVFRKQQEMQA